VSAAAPGAATRLTAALLGALYLAAGLAHLAWPDAFMRIVPEIVLEIVPWPRQVVIATGLIEIFGAVGLQMRRFRRAAGLGLALYALLVWPANLKHALDGIAIGGLPTSWWYHGPRLAFQPVLIIAALYAGGWRLGRVSAKAP
jgi:uncharacterized membrane protein